MDCTRAEERLEKELAVEGFEGASQEGNSRCSKSDGVETSHLSTNHIPPMPLARASAGMLDNKQISV